MPRAAFKSLPAFRTERPAYCLNMYGHVYRERRAAAEARALGLTAG